MDIRKYSKKTWIAVLIVALLSVILEILTLTNVIGDPSSHSMAKLSLLVGLLGVYYSIRGIWYHVKKEKEELE